MMPHGALGAAGIMTSTYSRRRPQSEKNDKFRAPPRLGLSMRRLIFAVAGAAALCLALPVGAAVQLVAPAALRELLERHLPLDAPGGAATDGDLATRSTIERRLRKEAGELLATEGYFSPQLEFRDGGDGLVLRVDPGPRAQIGSLRIEIRGALDDRRRQQLIDAWSLPVASVFRQSAWDEAKQGLLRELMAIDHSGARLLSSQAEVDVDAARVALHLIYDSGPRYRYGELRIIGLHRYPQSLVERYCETLQAGLPYRQEDLLSVQTALQNTPYFSSVSVELAAAASSADIPVDSQAAAPDEEVLPVIISLRERAPFHIALGAGYSTNTGARVEGSFRSTDLFHRAWELNTGVRLEQLRQIAYADIFLPPDREKRRDSLGAVIEKSDIQGLGIERVAFAAARVERSGPFEQHLGLGWQHEQQSPEGAPASINRALTATTGWLWRHADDPLDPGEGIVAQLQLGAAAKALLSDQSFLRSYFRYSQGVAIDKTNSLLLRGELGVTFANSRQGIPQDFLFRAGGSNSVRGYDYQSLGVKEGSATLGGRYLITLSAEYTHWIDAQWGIAAFADAGQAADDRDVLKLAAGYGLGARWKSPAGPLAIDLAWGQRDQELRLHFSLAVPF
jgi:translocation and assembly module TamA